MLGAFGQVREILVRQVHEVLLHVVAGKVDEILADHIAWSARSGVQHHPHVIAFIEADLDEVIAGAKRPQLVGRCLVRDPRMLLDDRAITIIEIAPARANGVRHGLPTAAARPSLGRHEAVRHGAFDVGADRSEVVRQLMRLDGQLPGHHPAADVDTDGGRDDRPFRRDDGADRGADAVVAVGHRRDMLVNERQLRDILHLLDGNVVDLDILRPHLERCAARDLDVFMV